MANPKNIKLIIFQSVPLSILLLALQGSSQQPDILTSSSSIKDRHFIVSNGNVFKFGFFTPENSTNRYLGIVYVVSDRVSIWVANRDKPLTDSSGTVTISRDGNLILSNGQNETLWTTNAKLTSPLNTTAQILDTGNLVLRDVSSGNVVWESFMHPVHVFVPTMKMMNDSGTIKKVMLSSWKTDSDPSMGNFTHGVEFRTIPQTFTWNNIDGRPHWRSGPWDGKNFLRVLTNLGSPNPATFRVGYDSSGTWYVTLIPDAHFLFKITLDPFGTIVATLWDDLTKAWIVGDLLPRNECDVYGRCGPFGNCNWQHSPICSCLHGFEPIDREEWRKGNWSGGCVRRTQLRCDRTNTQSTDGGNIRDGFLRMQNMKVPDFPQWIPTRQEDDCETICLRNCSCAAHAYEPNIGCMIWSGSLIDLQQFQALGLDLYIRLASSELGDHGNKDKRLRIIIPILVATISILIMLLIGGLWLRKSKGKKIIIGEQTHLSDSTSIILIDKSQIINIKELPLFTLEMLANVTDHFHDDKLLGKGGFGPVYKGNLANGKEIAVKRLSEASRQGTKEFMNEVMVISKLQHRNLVKLIGCCVEKDEKMLVYDYMPNKSLDMCLFDLNQQSENILDWKKRINIIEGIGRGLLYLHRDSRLKIIHRDLKPSNVLLDEDWNPKISDFGMARIVGVDQDKGNTSLVVGTYGYMAPEYATEGRFSEKSDVYSFGVLMLEIISGKKSTRYYDQEQRLSLLGCAWKWWSEKNGLAFMDQTLKFSSDCEEEITRCMHIALLCVQEFPEDRPDTQTVISMISHEIMDLAIPEKPVFAEKWNRPQVQIREHSISELTLSIVDGR